MDNQNTNNEMNRNGGVNINPMGIPTPEMPSMNGNTTPVAGEVGTSSAPVTPTLNNAQEVVIPNQASAEPVPPVKPTLDSILNGGTVMNSQPIGEESMSSTPLEAKAVSEEPVASPIMTHANPTMDIPVVDNSASTIIPSNTSSMNANGNVSEPVIETIPDVSTSGVSNTADQVAANSAPLNQENVSSNVPSGTLNTASVNLEPKVETLDTLPIQEPVLENVSSASSVQEEVVPVTPVVEQTVGIETLDNSTVPEEPKDDFGAVPVPPVFDDGKKKKKKEKKERNKEDGKKTIIVLLIIVLIAAIGFGVYYFLSMAKESASQASIVLKDMKLELGSTLSSNIDDYATITGYDKANCTLDLANVNLNKVSTYKYKVTCGKQEKEGTIIVDDSQPPKVTVNDLILTPNAALNPEDFIEKCTDASSCSYKFAEDYATLTEKLGDYEVKIIVSDDFNNEATVVAKLTVSRNAPVKYLTCTSKEENLEEIPASFVHSYRIGIDGNNTFYNAVKTSVFTYTTLEEYNSAIRGYDSAVGIHGIIGTEAFNEAEKSISIKTNKTLNEMNEDLNGNLPNNEVVIRAYLSGLGYTCN